MSLPPVPPDPPGHGCSAVPRPLHPTVTDKSNFPVQGDGPPESGVNSMVALATHDFAESDVQFGNWWQRPSSPPMPLKVTMHSVQKEDVLTLASQSQLKTGASTGDAWALSPFGVIPSAMARTAAIKTTTLHFMFSLLRCRTHADQTVSRKWTSSVRMPRMPPK